MGITALSLALDIACLNFSILLSSSNTQNTLSNLSVLPVSPFSLLSFTLQALSTIFRGSPPAADIIYIFVVGNFNSVISALK